MLRQQAAVARFGGFALREPDLTKILTEAARACADGLGVPFSQVWQHRAETNDLVVVAGHGWRDDVVGHAVSSADMRSPQARAFTAGETSIEGDLQNRNGCGLPPFYAAHGIVSIVDVIIKDDGDQPYGLLEIGADRPRDCDRDDIHFLTGFADVLAEAVSSASREAAFQVSVDQLKALIEEKDRLLCEKNVADLQLRQAQKMQAVNNILTVITGTIEILAEGVADRPELLAITRMIDQAGARGANLTHRLLAFARKQPLQPREVDINALVMEAANLLRPMLGEQVEVHLMLGADTSRALIDPRPLTSAILNLALNARDAMANGGKLIIETGNVVLDDSYAAIHSDVTAGKYVTVAVITFSNPSSPPRTLARGPASASAWSMDSSNSPTGISESKARKAAARR